MRKVLVGLVIVMSLVGCGSSSGGDPVGAVNAVINAFKSKDFAAIAPLICAAKRDVVAAEMDPAQALASAAPGVTASQIIDAISIDVQNFTATQASISGTSAVVNVTGTITINMDPTKARDIIRSVLAAAAEPTDDATIDQVLPVMTASISKPNDISGPVNVTQEGGVWLVCDDLAFH